jgi:hypothetical protein
LVEIKRKLYKRGSSYEITIPMPLLFSVDKNKKNDIIFKFDEAKKKWYIEIAPAEIASEADEEEG